MCEDILNEKQEQLIYGCSLGKLSFHKKNSIILQSVDEEYINYKYNILKNISNKPPITRTNKNGCVYFSFITKRHNVLESIYNETSKITIDWLNKINDYGFTLYWLDSGTIYKRNDNYYLKLKAPKDDESARLVQKWMKDKFNINATICKNGIRSKTFYLTSNSRDILKDMVFKYKDEFKGDILRKFNF